MHGRRVSGRSVIFSMFTSIFFHWTILPSYNATASNVLRSSLERLTSVQLSQMPMLGIVASTVMCLRMQKKSKVQGWDGFFETLQEPQRSSIKLLSVLQSWPTVLVIYRLSLHWGSFKSECSARTTNVHITGGEDLGALSLYVIFRKRARHDIF